MLIRPSFRRSPLLALAAIVSLTAFPVSSFAQNDSAGNGKADQAQHANHTQGDAPSLAVQLRALQTKVAALEAALKQNHQVPQDASGTKMGSMGGGKMGMSKGMGMMSGRKGMSGQGMSGMSMDGKGMGGMSGMGGISMDGMGMAGASRMNMGGMGASGMGTMGHPGMQMMGQMQGMGSMQMATALPGFPGASHIYHVGATEFFLDHPQHITLTTEQQTQLNGIKEETLLGQATFDRWIAQGEQEVWVLTSADAPDATQIEAKVREIAKLSADKRIAFIKAVGEAARVLTDEQRQALVGHLPPQHTSVGGNTQN